MEPGERTRRRTRRDLVRDASYRTQGEVSRRTPGGHEQAGSSDPSGVPHASYVAGGPADSDPLYPQYNLSPLHCYSDTMDQNNYFGHALSPGPQQRQHQSPHGSTSHHSPLYYPGGANDEIPSYIPWGSQNAPGNMEEEAQAWVPTAEPEDDDDAAEGTSSQARPPRSVKKGRYEPELQFRVSGGPENPELLKGFVNHMAYTIYQRLPVPPLKFQQRGKQTRSWHLESSKPWGHLARSSGLCHMPYVIHEHVHETLIQAFVERWQPETSSFHMPWGEMTITLHDVLLILSLNIHGRALSPPRGSLTVSDLKKAMVAQAAGFYGLAPRDVSAATVAAALFERHCRNLNDEKRASGYLLHLLGSCLFPDKTQHKLPLYYHMFLEDHSSTDEYAWGAAVLAHVYHSLGECTRTEARVMSTCYTLIQAWIYQYFPLFRPAESSDWDSDDAVCWAARWDLRAKPNSTRNYREELDRMTGDKVDWSPYGTVDFTAPRFAPSRFHGVISCLWITEPYMPDRVARQFCRVQQIPRAPIEPLRAWRATKIPSYKVDYDAARFAWDAQTVHSMTLAELGPAIEEGDDDCSDEYMDWYIPRTHPLVNPPTIEDATRAFQNVYDELEPLQNYVDEDVAEAVRRSFGYMYPFLPNH